MKMLSKRKFVESVSYEQFFQWEDSTGSGFGFPCNEKGDIDLDAIPNAARQNLTECLFGVKNVSYVGIQEFHHHYNEPAIGECHCGCEVLLDSFTNTCDRCGRDYNMSGQELADRSQWGEETGESLSDILSIG